MSPGLARVRRKASRRARILFEGAQGALLDNDHGTYPFVTRRTRSPGKTAAGSGLRPTAIGYVLGLPRPYTTRVGEGPFPCELNDEIGSTYRPSGAKWASTPAGRAAAAGSILFLCGRRCAPRGLPELR